MSKPLIFIGSRNDFPTVALIAELHGVEILGILDHHYYGNTEYMSKIPVIGDERWLLDPNNIQAQQWLRTCDFFPANWNDGSQSINKIDILSLRLERIRILEESKANVVNLIHPNASVDGITSKYSDNFSLGRGILIDDTCWISINNTQIGDYCQFGIGVYVGHNATIGKNVTVAPWATLPRCTIGENTVIGMHARIDAIGAHRPGTLSIGSGTTIWANALISKDVPNDSIYTDKGRIFKKKSHL
jgi:carbonic anhydrase/acetyltransferase-like protein (isoleucine patch superfamily)